MKFFDFLEFSFIDLLDIVLFATLLYYLYKLAKGTVVINIFIGIVVIYIIWQITKALKMELMSSVFGDFIGVGFFALVVVFQEEIREILLKLGGSSALSGRKAIRRFFEWKDNKNNTEIKEIINSCKKISHKKNGALIIIERDSSLETAKRTGDKMKIELDSNILINLFDKRSAFHDGAIIVKGLFIVATRVILPVSKNNKIPLKYGLRHRAAIGATENTDAVAVVVSEETGKISYIRNGKFIPYKTEEQLYKIMKHDINN